MIAMIVNPDFDELQIDQQWIDTRNPYRTVTIRGIEGELIQYGEYGNDRTYETCWINFRSRFGLKVN